VLLCLTAGSSSRLQAATADGNGGQQSGQSQQAPSANALLLDSIRVSVASDGAMQLSLQGGLANQVQNNNPPPSDGTETIVVWGQRIGGGPVSINFVCASVMCGSMQDSMSSWLQNRLREASKQYVEPEEVQDKVCESIRALAPSYCYTNYAPVNNTRYFPSSWTFPAATNGCGAGGVLEDLVFGRARSQYNWNDDINEPISGKSFRSACNNHDVCYSSQHDRLSCDKAFREQMYAACNGAGVTCTDAADIYYVAVRGNSATSAYIRAGQASTCRRVQQSYTANSCPG